MPRQRRRLASPEGKPLRYDNFRNRIWYPALRAAGCRTELDRLLRRISTYLVRWARRKFKRLRAFKRAKRWWNGLLRRQPALFAHWARMTEF